MPGFSGAKVEMKFQLVGPDWITSSNMSKDFDYMKITETAFEWNDTYTSDGDTHDDVESFPISSASDLLLIKFDGVNQTMTINGNVSTCDRSSMSAPRLFATYDSDSEQVDYTGITDGAKLYYVKAWDEDGTLNYIGYATTHTNSASGRIEYCWCNYHPKTGEVSYTFANDAANQGGFEGYTYE